MAKRKKHRRRSGRVQVWIPEKVRAAFGGKRVIQRPARSKADAAEIAAQIQREIERARAGLPPPDEVLAEIAELEHRRAFDIMAGRFREYRGRLEAIDRALELESIGFDDPNPFLAGGTAADFARAKLARLGREPDAATVAKLAAAIIQAQRDAVAMIQRGHSPPPLPGKPAPVRPATSGEGKRVSELIGEYIAERPDLKPKSQAQARASLEAFAEFAGDPTAAAIDRQLVKSWKAAQLATSAAPATVNRNLSALSKFWQYCQDGAEIGDNASNPILRQWAKKSAATRRIYTAAELERLLAPSSIRLHILAALFSGLRLEEVTRAKIGEENGIKYFDVPRGKTPASARRCPLHPRLIEEGVASRARELRALSPSVVSKRFTRWRRQCGIVDDSAVYHSLRHTFATKLARARPAVPQIWRRYVLGHAASGMDGTYVHGADLADLAEYVARVDPFKETTEGEEEAEPSRPAGGTTERKES